MSIMIVLVMMGGRMVFMIFVLRKWMVIFISVSMILVIRIELVMLFCIFFWL